MAAYEQEDAIHHITIHCRRGAEIKFSEAGFWGKAEACAPHPFANRVGSPKPNIGVM